MPNQEEGVGKGKGCAGLTGGIERRLAARHRICADCHGTETLWRFLYYHKELRNPHTKLQQNVRKTLDTTRSISRI